MRSIAGAGRGSVPGAAAILLGALAASCAAGEGDLGGTIEVDGSVALFPLTDAIGEAFVERTGAAVWVPVGLPLNHASYAANRSRLERARR